jgi:hypothetical protein
MFIFIIFSERTADSVKLLCVFEGSLMCPFIYIYMKIQGMLKAFSVDFMVNHIEMNEQIVLKIS